MNLITNFWRKICVPLDGYLWHRDITHHLIRPVLRNQILASGAFILAGAAIYAAAPWLFWFGSGFCCITWIFWSWARFFLGANISDYSAAFLRAILLRFLLRLVILALLLYMAFAFCQAPASAIVAGMIGGSLLGLGTFAYNMKFTGRS